MLCATLAAPPIRCVSWRKATTGTGASGEIRVTAPTMNVSSMASPTTRTWAPAKPDTRRVARSVASGANGMVAAGSREWQRDEHEQEHQEFGIAEVVFEEARSEHRRDGREPRGGRHLVLLGAKQADEPDPQRHDEPQPDRQRRQAAFRRNLQRYVVQMWID